jgi:hypothetical protein
MRVGGWVYACEMFVFTTFWRFFPTSEAVDSTEMGHNQCPSEWYGPRGPLDPWPWGRGPLEI